MQIALVAIVLLAGMWFTVLKPKSDDGATAPVAATPAVAPGTKGLVSAVDKAKAASATSDAANAKIQAASGGAASATITKTPAAAAKAKSTAAARKGGTKAATKKATAKKAAVDPSNRLLSVLSKHKTLVILFYGKGADDKAARKAVHRTALKSPKTVTSAYVPITEVGRYEAITGIVNILAAPTVVVIGTDHKATALTGFIQTSTVMQAVGDARRNAAPAAKKSKSKK